MSTVTVQGLREQVRGQTITPGDSDYDEARRVYNAMIDRHPNVVVRAAGTDDVVAAVNYARENGLAVAIRGGSHSVPGFGTGEDAVVIDLKGMQQVEVDPARKTARAQGGATWGAFNDATHAHGLATTGGIISTTGVGGLTLGGGIGYLTRGHGLSCDNLRAAEVVTADGKVVAATEHENADLFWALRGGGGNFGVVTAFEYDAAPGERDLRRPDVLRALRRRRRAALVPRVHPGRRRAARRLPGVADRPAAPVHPRGPPRRAVHGLRLLLGRPARGGRGGAEVAARGRAARRRARRARCPTRRSTARSTRWSRPGCSTTGRRTSSRSSPTTRSPRTSSTGRRCRPSTRPCTSIRSTARPTAWGRATPRSPTATRRSPP